MEHVHVSMVGYGSTASSNILTQELNSYVKANVEFWYLL